MTIIYRRILIILAVLGSAVFILNTLVNNVYTHRFAEAMIHKKFSEQSDLQLDFKSLDVSFFPLELNIYGVNISSSDKLTEPLLKLSLIQLQVSWWDVILGNKILSKAVLHELEADYPTKYTQDKLFKKVDQKDKSEGTKITWPIETIPIREIVLLNARIFAYLNADKKAKSEDLIYSSLKGVDIRLKFDRLKNIYLDFIIASSNLYIGDNNIISDARIIGEISQVDQDIKGKYLSIFSKNFDLKGSLNGHLNINQKTHTLSDISFKQTWKGTVDLNTLGKYLNIKDTSGFATGDYIVNTKIPMGNKKSTSITASGDVKLKSGIFSGINLFESKTKFDLDSSKILLSDINIIIGNQTYGKGNGQIKFDEAGSFNFDTSIMDMPLKDLMAIFNSKLDSFNFDLESENLKLLGQSNPFKMTAQAITKLDNITSKTFPHPTLYSKSPKCHLNLQLNIDSEAMSFTPDTATCFPHQNTLSKTSTLNSLDSKTETPSDKISYDGILYFNEEKGVDFNVQGTDLRFELASYFVQTKLSGLITTKTKIFGPYSKIQYDNDIIAQNINIDHSLIKQLEGNILYSDGIVNFKNASLNPTPKSQIIIEQGGLKLENLELLPTKFKFNNIDQQFFNDFLGIENFEYTFNSLEGYGNWSGLLLKPGKSFGHLNINFKKLKYKNEIIADQIQTKLDSNLKYFSIKPSFLKHGDMKFLFSGNIEKRQHLDTKIKNNDENETLYTKLGFEKNDKISLTFKTIDETKNTSDIQHLPFVSQHFQAIDLEGQLNLNLQLTGNFESLSGTISSRLKRMSIFQSQLPDLIVNGSFEDSKLQFKVSQLGQNLIGTLNLSLTDELPYDWNFNFNNFDVRAFTSSLFYSDPRNFAYLNGKWTLKGQMTNWWKSTGELVIDNFLVSYNHDQDEQTKVLKFSNKDPLSLQFSEHGWKFKDSKKIEVNNSMVNFSLDLVDSKPPENLNIIFSSKFNAQFFKEIFDQIEDSSGTFYANGNLKGPISDLILTGRAYTKKDDTENALSLSFPSMRPAFKKINFDLTYENSVLNIDHFEAEKGQGKIKSFGKINFNESSKEKSNLRTTFNNIRVDFPVPYLSNFDTILSGDLQLTGISKPYLLAGDIHINSARSNQKIDLIDEVVAAFRQDTFVDTSPQALQSHFFDFNINIFADKSIVINNNTVQAVISSNIQLQGHEHKAILIGNLNIDKGKFQYKRTFDVTRGLIIFDDQISSDPKLDIIAQTEILPYTITIAISEKASNPVVEILVDPPTREDNQVITPLESIVLLSTGRLPKSQNSNDAANLGVSEFINILGSQSKVPFDKLSEIFGKDFIRVYPDITINEKGLPTLQINGDINLTENIEAGIKYIPDSNTKKAEMEIPIHKNISFSGSLEQGGNDESSDSEGVENRSVDIRFKFSIK